MEAAEPPNFTPLATVVHFLWLPTQPKILIIEGNQVPKTNKSTPNTLLDHIAIKEMWTNRIDSHSFTYSHNWSFIHHHWLFGKYNYTKSIVLGEPKPHNLLVSKFRSVFGRLRLVLLETPVHPLPPVGCRWCRIREETSTNHRIVFSPTLLTKGFEAASGNRRERGFEGTACQNARGIRYRVFYISEIQTWQISQV